MMVAALYIDPRGPYPWIEGVDAWDEARDARRYLGTDPVVAHPPCGPWGRLKAFAKKPGQVELGPIAVGQVRRFGGVLEHPKGSKLWDACGLPKPGELRDGWGGYSIEVRQVDWGHVAEKATWLYLVRVPTSAIEWPEPMVPTHVVTWDRRKGRRAPMKQCGAEQRRRTPPDFARYLVSLARAAA